MNMAVRILPTTLRKKYIVEIDGNCYICIEEWSQGTDKRDAFMLDRYIIQSQIIEGTMKEVRIQDKDLKARIVSAIDERLDAETRPSINIEYMLTPPMSSEANEGRMYMSFGESVLRYLRDSEEWTDDEIFVDSEDRRYSIDDLIGKQVKVANEIFIVQE